MYETYYNKLQQFFWNNYIHLNYMDTDRFVLSLNTNDIAKELQNLNLFDFSNLDKMFSVMKKTKVLGNSKIETLKRKWRGENIYLGRKAHSIKYNDKNTNKLKKFSKSQFKKNSFEDFYNCFFLKENIKNDKYVIRSIILNVYPQKVRKNTLSAFD